MVYEQFTQRFAAPSNRRHATISGHQESEGRDGDTGTLPTGEGWLVPLLIAAMLEGNVYGGQIRARTEEFGFDLSSPETVYETLHAMQEEGLIVSNRNGGEVLLSRWTFEPTEAGEAYLEFWAHSLMRYREEMDRFFRIYNALNDSAEPVGR